jgi:hypothetical protein
MTLGVYAIADSPIAATPADDAVFESLTLVDQSTRTAAFVRQVSDALAVVDQSTAIHIAGQLVSDHLTLTDQATARVSDVAQVAEVLTAVETSVAHFIRYDSLIDVLYIRDQPDESLVVGEYRDDTDQGPLWGLDTTPGQP